VSKQRRRSITKRATGRTVLAAAALETPQRPPLALPACDRAGNACQSVPEVLRKRATSANYDLE
jgi:hypothetical protein